MQIACVLVTHLPFKLELQRDPSLEKRSVIIFQRRGSQRTVLDTSPGISQVKPGMSLQEALANCKDAVPIEADIPYYQKAFTQILLRLENWSPAVEAADLGHVYVGLNGLEDTYGNMEHLMTGLLHAIPPYLEPRLGVSTGKFPAYLAALRAQPGSAYKPPTEVREFMAAFPVEVLPVSWQIKARFRGFGLDTLGKIAELPIGPVQAQFGPIGAKVWRLAHGIDDSPLMVRQYEEEVTASFTFPTPTAYSEPLMMAVDHLLARLFAQPDMRGRYARITFLESCVVNKPTWQHRVVFKTPVGSRTHAYIILKGLLDGLTLPGPLEEIRMTLKELTGEGGKQESLFNEVRQMERLHQVIAQLKASQGRNPIYRVREVEPWSRIPERRLALVTYEP